MRFENRSQLPHIHWLFFARLERFSYVFFAPSFFFDFGRQREAAERQTKCNKCRCGQVKRGRKWAGLGRHRPTLANDFQWLFPSRQISVQIFEAPYYICFVFFFWTLEKKFVFSKCVCCLKLICWSAKSLIDLAPPRPLCFWVNLHGHGFDWV